MFNSQVLEIAIGLIFVFLIASLLASVVREFIESILKTRAVQLERGVRLLLDDPTGKQTAASLFGHPQLFSLFDGVYDPNRMTGFFRIWKKSETTLSDGTVHKAKAERMPFMSNLPSYIPSRNFALALLDTLGRQGADAPGSVPTGGAYSMETLMAHANALAPSRVRDALLVALNEAQGDFDRARTSLEAWFDSNMDRVSGWYKRESQLVLLVLGMITAVAFDIDAIKVSRELATNNTVLAQVVLQAEATRATLKPVPPDQAASAAQQANAKALQDARKGLGDLIGWPRRDDWWHGAGFWSALLGWTVTALAISLGAPFWFDLLNKMMVVRSTAKPFEKSPAEGSEDRAGATPSAQRLKPRLVTGAATAAAAGTASAAPSAMAGPVLGSVRLAVDTDNLTGLALKVDGADVELPRSGLIELTVTMGDDHLLELTATTGSQAVYWSKVVRVTLDEDAPAVDAKLT
jgi:hypothetical protein